MSEQPQSVRDAMIEKRSRMIGLDKESEVRNGTKEQTNCSDSSSNDEVTNNQDAI